MSTIETLKEQIFQMNQMLHAPDKITLSSGWKPDGYYLPRIHVGTSKTISDEIPLSYHVEVLWNSTVVFRGSHIPNEGEAIKIVEGMLARRILNNMCMMGFMEAKRSIDNNPKV